MKPTFNQMQQVYDNTEQDSGVYEYQCEECGHEWTGGDSSWYTCPECGHVVDSGDYDEPDEPDYDDEPMCWGGRDYP